MKNTEMMMTRREQLEAQRADAQAAIEAKHKHRDVLVDALRAEKISPQERMRLEKELLDATTELHRARDFMRDINRELEPIARRQGAPAAIEAADAELARLADEVREVDDALARNTERTSALDARRESLALKVEATKAKLTEAVLEGRTLDLGAAAKAGLELDAVGSALAQLADERADLDQRKADILGAQREAREARRAAEGVLIVPEARQALAGIVEVVARFIDHHGRSELDDLIDDVLREAGDADDRIVIRPAPDMPSLWAPEKPERTSDSWSGLRDGGSFDTSGTFTKRKTATWRGKK